MKQGSKVLISLFVIAIVFTALYVSCYSYVEAVNKPGINKVHSPEEIARFKAQIASQSHRLISLIPSSTELGFALGFGEKFVAVSHYCNYPEKEIKELPRIGDQNIDVEKILSLKPTLVIDTNSIHQRYLQLFEKLKLPYINLEIKQIEDMPKAALKLAKALNDESKAQAFIENWNYELSKLNSFNGESRPKIYIEIWNNPIQACGGNNNINSIFETAGGENILRDEKDFPTINNEMLISKNPDIIFLAYPVEDLEAVAKRPGWNNIKAVKKGHIFKINQDIIVRPGPRNLEAVKEINQIINKVWNNEVK